MYPSRYRASLRERIIADLRYYAGFVPEFLAGAILLLFVFFLFPILASLF